MRLHRAVGAAVVAVAAGSLSWVAQAPAHASSSNLVGLFKLQAGSWSGSADNGHVEGTYFRMMQKDGKTYLSNADSRAADKTYTILNPGTDGGLRTGSFQSTPNPAFASNGDALSGKVTAPEKFFGIQFATATNEKDPQTGKTTVVPTIKADGSKLSGDLRAFAASWNNLHFNQGAPKPDGSKPGYTKEVSGTYNSSTKAFTITWRSQIKGGPFNNFTGEWHLVGTFSGTSTASTSSSGDHSNDNSSSNSNSNSNSNDDSNSSSSTPTPTPTATETASASASASPSADGATPGTDATAVAGQETWTDDNPSKGESGNVPKVLGTFAGVIALALLVWFGVVQRLRRQTGRRSRFHH